MDFCIQGKGQTFAEALETWHGKIESAKPVIDVGFHLAVTDLHEGGTLEELARMPDEGVTSYKLFMAYKGAIMVDDETLFRVMQTAADTGALVMVHAEHGDSIDVLVKQALAEGKTDPMWHARTRPPETEGEATNRADPARARGRLQPLRRPRLVQGVDRPDRARQGARLGRARARRARSTSSSTRRSSSGPTSRAPSTSTRRRRARKRTRSTSGTRSSTDILSVISTDHCPFRWADQKSLGKDDFSKIPNGGPGLEDRLMMIHEFGVRGGRITLNRMVELLSTNPAKYFGLYPRKGTIAVGSDADIVVFDPDKRVTLSAERSHSRVDYNLYEGTEVTGAPEVVLVRGKVIVEAGELVGQPGDGRFVKRARFGEQLTTAAGATA